jgi:cytochrome oxidase Cu insertion factor (SCO1/SenC/PrrC family)
MKVKIAGALALLIFGLSCRSNQEATPNGLVQRTSPVQVGEPAPDFTLEDQHQQKVTLSSARDVAPTVLVFYRGHW